MEQRSGFSWVELAIVSVILIAIFGFTSLSSRAMLTHARNRRAHVHRVVSR